MGGAVFPPCSFQTGRGNGCNGELLQKDFCRHTEPPRTAVASALTPRCRPTPHQRVPHTHGQVWPVSCGVTAPLPRSWCTQGFVCAFQASLAGMRFDLKAIAPLLSSCCGFSFAFGCGLSFLVGSNLNLHCCCCC